MESRSHGDTALQGFVASCVSVGHWLRRNLEFRADQRRNESGPVIQAVRQVSRHLAGALAYLDLPQEGYHPAFGANAHGPQRPGGRLSGMMNEVYAVVLQHCSTNHEGLQWL